MEYIKLGQTGERIPVLGLGTYLMGGGHSPNNLRDKDWVQAIRAAAEMGYTLIDTAEEYGAGHSEELVGEAIKPLDRDELFIVSKVSPDRRFLDIIRSAKASVKRLGTHMDLYLIHMPPHGPMKQTIHGLEKVVDMGMARHIGVSNFNEKLTLEAMQFTSKYPIVVNQSELSLTDSHLALLDACNGLGVTFMAYSPLGRGRLFKHPKFGVLEEFAKKLGKTPVQVALRWTIEAGTQTLVKSDSIPHLEENLGSLGWKLGGDWGKLTDAFLGEK